MKARLRTLLHENAMFLRFWCAIMLTAATLVTIAACCVFGFVRNVMTSQLKVSEAHYLQSVEATLDSYLQLAQRTCESLASNEKIRQAILTNNQNWIGSLHDCSLAVRQALSSSPCFAGICLVAGDELLLRSIRTYQPPSYDQRMIDLVVQKMDDRFYPWKMESGSKTCNYLSFVATAGGLAVPNEVGGVLVTLDMDKVASRALGSSSGIFYMTNQAGDVILSTDPHAFLQNAETLPHLASAAKGDEYRDQSMRYVISRSTSSAYGYTCYHLQPYSLFYSPLSHLASISVLIVLVCAAVAVPVSLGLAHNVYRPVKNVFIQLVTDLPVSPQQGMPPLNEVQRASRAIVHTYETINAYRQDIDASTLRAFLVSGTPMPGTADGLAHYLAASETSRIRLAVVAVPAAPSSTQRAADIIASYLSERGRLVVVSTEHNTISLVLTETVPIADDAFDGLLNSALDSLRQLVPQYVLVSVAPLCTGPSALPKAYAAASGRLALSALYRQSAILRPAVSAQEPLPAPQLVCEAVRRMEPECFLEELNAFLDALKTLPEEDALQHLTVLALRVTALRGALPERPSDALPLYGDTYRTLSAMESHDALIAYFTELFLACTATIDEARDPEGKRTAELAMAYITQHYTQSALSAGQVADALHISVSHLSRLLKKHYGKTFLTIVSNLRMDKAVSLLTGSPSMSISALCHACGFSSPSYFTANFKKIYGVTPSDYRQISSASPILEAPGETGIPVEPHGA